MRQQLFVYLLPQVTDCGGDGRKSTGRLCSISMRGVDEEVQENGRPGEKLWTIQANELVWSTIRHELFGRSEASKGASIASSVSAGVNFSQSLWVKGGKGRCGRIRWVRKVSAKVLRKPSSACQLRNEMGGSENKFARHQEFRRRPWVWTC